MMASSDMASSADDDVGQYQIPTARVGDCGSAFGPTLQVATSSDTAFLREALTHYQMVS